MAAPRNQTLSKHLLGEQVQLERRRLGMTQADLANQVGSTQSQISLLERGQVGAVSTETLERITSLLEISKSKTSSPASTGGYCPNPLCCAAVRQKDSFGFLDGTIYRLESPKYTLNPWFSQTAYCKHCGTKMQKSCPDCGNEIPSGGCHCDTCGVPFIGLAHARTVCESVPIPLGIQNLQSCERGV